MKYVIADKSLAGDFGFDEYTHRTNKKDIILNEKEVMSKASLEGDTLEKKVEKMNGKVYERAELIQIISEGGWND